MGKLIDPLQAIQERISDLESHNAKLEQQLEVYRKKNKDKDKIIDNLRGQLQRAQGTAVNESELEKLRIQNGQLMVEVNKQKRQSKSDETLNKIRKLLNQ